MFNIDYEKFRHNFRIHCIICNRHSELEDFRVNSVHEMLNASKYVVHLFYSDTKMMLFDMGVKSNHS